MTVAPIFLNVMAMQYLAINVWKMCVLDVFQSLFIKDFFVGDVMCECVSEKERDRWCNQEG